MHILSIATWIDKYTDDIGLRRRTEWLRPSHGHFEFFSPLGRLTFPCAFNLAVDLNSLHCHSISMEADGITLVGSVGLGSLVYGRTRALAFAPEVRGHGSVSVSGARSGARLIGRVRNSRRVGPGAILSAALLGSQASCSQRA